MKINCKGKHLFLCRMILMMSMVLLCPQILISKTMTIDKIESAVGDLSARTNMREDANGEKCSLLRIQLPIEGALFEGNIIGDVRFKVNRYDVYVTHSTKKIRISCPGFFSVMVDFPKNNVTLEGGEVYDIYCNLGNDLDLSQNEFKSKMTLGEQYVENQEYYKAIDYFNEMSSTLSSSDIIVYGLTLNRRIDYCKRQIALKTLTGIETGVLKEGLVAFRKNDSYGFVDSIGKVIIPPIYEEVIDFRDGIAWVKDKGLWGSVDKNGKLVVQNKYKYLTDLKPNVYADNICSIGWKESKKGDIAEIFDYKTGDLLFNLNFRDVYSYGNDDYSYFCCLDDKGNIIAVDKKAGKEKFKIPKGKSFAGYLTSDCISIYDGKLSEMNKPRFGVADETGKEIIPCNHYAIQPLGGEYGHIVKVLPEDRGYFEPVNYLYNLKLKRRIGGLYSSFYSQIDTWDCPMIVTSFYNGKETMGVLNLIDGTDIINSHHSLGRSANRRYNKIQLPRTQQDPIVGQSPDDSNYYLIDHQGNEYASIDSDCYLWFENGLSHYKKDGKFGIIDTKGNVVVSPKFDKIEAFKIDSKGVLKARVYESHQSYYIDSNGNKTN